MNRDDVLARHRWWCEVLDEWVLDSHLPACDPLGVAVHLDAGNKAGWYDPIARHGYPGPTCHYVLPYALLYPVEYDETIAHECCHHYAHHILPGGHYHGDFWKFLLRIVCGFRDAQARHNFSVASARALGDILKLTEHITS